MSISHSSAVPKLTGGLISIDVIRTKTSTTYRRSKIVCTIGPACWNLDQLETLVESGMNVARLNLSHDNHAVHAATIERIREAARNKERNIAIMVETQGPTLRTGLLANDAKEIDLIKGESIILTTDYFFKGDSSKLACSYESLAKTVEPGQEILVADGSLVLTVLTCDEAAGEVRCRIENNARIGERKNMNLPGVEVDLPTFTEKDIDDIVNFAIMNRVDFIAASSVRKGSDVTILRQLLADNGGQDIKIISKIENQEGLENYDEILQRTDAIMIERGNLAVEIPPHKVFLAQKMMIREANLAGKPVITATQMLESMTHNPRPTRAEASDVANAIIDGSDAVSLSGETANGPYFEQAVRVMARVCCEAERMRNFNAMYISINTSVVERYGHLSSGESLASSAVKTSIDINAAVICVMSESGETARLIAKFRPGRVIVCLTPNPVVARQAGGLFMGVHAYIVDSLSDHTLLSLEVGYECIVTGVAKPGDLMVVVAGTTFGKGQNNQIRVQPVYERPKEGVIKLMKHLHSFEYAATDD